ncbi:hypothetical protein HH219_16595 [Pseudoalteromonas sp. NEC-BIFX-2020_015]|uniref:hypothetical protein n=1 Tax=Pseudoalteromonas sp. NEC-BIFX-2020_015 TaxID=2729544 RepID=UPI0014614AC0|nr:hypothetical protein [Pseudoalteromonas sp. NEC-BIFX-2020_015]NMR27130.1 hypothetical protein [Pseudoalteromonas sp. NEC-BIFX-2020_015]
MNKILLFILLLPAFLLAKHVSAQGDGLICSNYWQAQFSSCPADKIAFIKQQTYIPTLQDSCSNGDAICIGDANNQPFYQPYAIYNIDDNEANRFQVKIVPKVVNANGLVTQQGHITVQRINSTQHERDFVKHLNEAQHYHKQVQDTLFFTQKDSVMYSGSEQSTVKSSLNACKTAMSYVNNDSNCGGILNNEIRLEVQNNANAIAVVAALDKASGFINLVLGNVETDKLNKILNYDVIMRFDDGSMIVVNVDVTRGVAKIIADLDASSAANGQTLKKFLNDINKVEDFYSPDELESLVRKNNLETHCRPQGVMTGVNTRLIRTVILVDKHGNERVINIYQRETTYIAVGNC